MLVKMISLFFKIFQFNNKDISLLKRSCEHSYKLDPVKFHEAKKIIMKSKILVEHKNDILYTREMYVNYYM